MSVTDPGILWVGTIGQGVWRSEDGGASFFRRNCGLASEADVRALLDDPARPGRMLAGTETGIYVSEDGGSAWRLSGGSEGYQTWTLVRDPRQPSRILAGGCPARILESRDGGDHWHALPIELPERCLNGAPLTPRVTCIHIDAVDGAHFVGVEIGGVYRSLADGHWTQHLDGLISADIHGLVSVWRNGRRYLLATTNADVHRSDDHGATWRLLGVGETWPWSYARIARIAPWNAAEVWIGAGNGPPGDEGGLFRTRDLGETWERLPLPARLNSTVWSLAFHPREHAVLTATICGQLFLLNDAGGDSPKVTRLPREFGEIRCLAWTERAR